MLRYQKPTVIELKKIDVDELEKKRREGKTPKSDMLSDSQTTQIPNVTTSPKFRQAEIRRRLGFSPEVVANDGTTGIHF